MKWIYYAVKDGGFFTCSFHNNEFGDFLLFFKNEQPHFEDSSVTLWLTAQLKSWNNAKLCLDA